MVISTLDIYYIRKKPTGDTGRVLTEIDLSLTMQQASAYQIRFVAAHPANFLVQT